MFPRQWLWLLVFIVLVGVPVFSYLALNIPRVAGTNREVLTGNAGQPAAEHDQDRRFRRRRLPIRWSLWRSNLAGESAAVASPITVPARGCESGQVRRRHVQRGSKMGSRSEGRCPLVRLNPPTPVETPAGQVFRLFRKRSWRFESLKRTYVKVTKDEEGTQPVFEGIAAPDSRPIIVEGKRFWVHVSDKGAVEVRKDGQLVLGNSDDIVIN